MKPIDIPQHSSWTPRRSPLGRVRAGIAAMLLLAGVAGCENGAEEGGAAAAGDSAGTIDGLSPEQLQQQAQPMSSEQAEQLGIVDTTEAPPPAPVAPGDTAAPVPTTTPPPSAP